MKFRIASLIVIALCLSAPGADTTQSSSSDRCMQYEPAASLIFEEGSAGQPTEPDCWRDLKTDNPDLFATLEARRLSQQLQQQTPVRPGAVGNNASDPQAGAAETIVFLHGLKSPAGHDRLVCMMASDRPAGMELRPIVMNFADLPPTSSATAQPMEVVNHADLPLRIHFGQVDADDTSKFKLAVDYCGQTYSMDCQLQDDDSILLEPSFGWVDPGGRWQVEEAARHLQIKEPMKIMQLGYGARIDGVGSYLSRDGKLLAIRSDNAQKHSQIDLWDTQTEQRISSWDAGEGFAWPRFSEDGASFTGLDNGQRIFYRFAIPSGKQLWRIDLSEVFTRPNSAHSFYLDDNRVAISSPDEGLVRLWDIKAHGQLLKRIHVPVEGQQNLTVSEDGKVMAFWQFQPQTPVLFFSLETGRIISRQPVNPSLEEFGFTADDRDFIEITDDGLVLVDVASGKIHFRRGSGGLWRGAKISASRNVIVSSFDAGVYNLPAADVFSELSLNGQSISTNSLGISGDGKRAVTLLDDGTWALWDLTAGK